MTKCYEDTPLVTVLLVLLPTLVLYLLAQRKCEHGKIASLNVRFELPLDKKPSREPSQSFKIIRRLPLQKISFRTFNIDLQYKKPGKEYKLFSGKTIVTTYSEIVKLNTPGGQDKNWGKIIPMGPEETRRRHPIQPIGSKKISQ